MFGGFVPEALGMCERVAMPAYHAATRDYAARIPLIIHFTLT